MEREKKNRKNSLLEKGKEGLCDREIPLNLGRRILAYEMMVSASEIPHVCYEYEPDVTDFVDHFKRLRKEKNLNVTLNTLVLKCIAEALKASPILNSHLYYKFKSAKGTIRTFEKVDINMPTLLPDGSMQALNVRDAGAGTLLDLDAKIKDLVGKTGDEILFGDAQFDLAYEQTINFLKQGKLNKVFPRLFGAYFGKERIRMHGTKSHFHYLRMVKKYKKTVDTSNAITKDDLREGTIVVSNIGSLKRDLTGRISLFEIIPPQVFAVMVCNLQREPRVINSDGEEKLEIRTILPFNLAFDHRACDFGDLIPFVERMDAFFSNPQIIDTWL